MLVLLAALAHAAPLELTVDPAAKEVVLKCGKLPEIRQAPRGGKVVVDPAPSSPCAVTLTFDGGAIQGPGVFACDPVCRQIEAQKPRPAPVASGPNTMVVIVEEGTAVSGFEVSCAGGWRDRKDVDDGQAVFTGLPQGDTCTLLYKGGPPGRFQPVSAGAWDCGLAGSTAVCRKR